MWPVGYNWSPQVLWQEYNESIVFVAIQSYPAWRETRASTFLL